jgi:methionine biosynthesis protein MetW
MGTMLSSWKWWNSRGWSKILSIKLFGVGLIMKTKTDRPDHQVIGNLIEPGSKVLDLGCGTGELLYLLAKYKKVKAQGIELNDEAIFKCVEKGLSVTHQDIDTGLAEYPDKSFDYVILNQSMQEVIKVDTVIKEALRVGDKVIVGFSNFASLKARCQMFFFGHSPVTQSLPYRWYDTPNLHFLSILDFWDYCHNNKLKVLGHAYLNGNNRIYLFPNLFAEEAIFVLTK